MSIQQEFENTIFAEDYKEQHFCSTQRESIDTEAFAQTGGQVKTLRADLFRFTECFYKWRRVRSCRRQPTMAQPASRRVCPQHESWPLFDSCVTSAVSSNWPLCFDGSCVHNSDLLTQSYKLVATFVQPLLIRKWLRSAGSIQWSTT